LEIKTGFIPFGKYQTWYRIVGAPSDKTPLLLLHGGPGSTHNYFEVLDELASLTGRQLIIYDQLGCGNSSMPDNHPELYTAATWVHELVNLRQQLQLTKIHLLGQSWGGMLAIIYLCDYHPHGVKSAILSSTLSSAKLWSQELHRLIKYLPNAEQAAITAAEDEHNFSDSAYLKANQHFMAEHVIDPTSNLPEPVKRPKRSGVVAYQTAWGPNEYTPIGNLHDYEYTNKLAQLSLPVLITSGTDDLCTPLNAKTMADQIPNSRWELFPNCGHMPFVQAQHDYLQLLKEWLAKHD
jgi:proline iminopeptidase